LSKNDKDFIGVVLLNLGGPDSLDAVEPFLYNLFSDRQIIKLGLRFMQRPLAWLIAKTRAKKTRMFYSQVGGKSPILDITLAQAKALEDQLNRQSAIGNQQSNLPTPPLLKKGEGGMPNNGHPKFKVYVGMRYWRPLIEEVIPEIYNSGIKRVIAFSLYPHYSVATAGSSLSKFKEVVADYPMEYLSIDSWYDHPSYIDALVDVIKKGLESFKSEIRDPKSEIDIHVLFSAHSLPQKMIEGGDPYVTQIIATIKEIAKRIEIKWHLSYQSRSGPVKWLEPSTDEQIKILAKEGINNILVVPISFVSDHIETLYEIDILYRNLAEGLGVKLRRSDSLNTHPVFIEALKDMVQNISKHAGWQ
jgi:protoporphyrin/coproporphyrin ferrochelatase